MTVLLENYFETLLKGKGFYGAQEILIVTDNTVSATKSAVVLRKSALLSSSRRASGSRVNRRRRSLLESSLTQSSSSLDEYIPPSRPSRRGSCEFVKEEETKKSYKDWSASSTSSYSGPPLPVSSLPSPMYTKGTVPMQETDTNILPGSSSDPSLRSLPIVHVPFQSSESSSSNSRSNESWNSTDRSSQASINRLASSPQSNVVCGSGTTKSKFKKSSSSKRSFRVKKSSTNRSIGMTANSTCREPPSLPTRKVSTALDYPADGQSASAGVLFLSPKSARWTASQLSESFLAPISI